MSETIIFSQKQIEFLLESAKILIPLSTGFILLISSSITKFKELKISNSESNKILIIGVYAWIIISIGLWSGVIAFMIDCSHPFERFDGATTFISFEQLNWEYRMGVLTAKCALISFFIGVILYSICAYRIFMKEY